MSNHRVERPILFLNEISMDDINLVGGKNASLGEMFRHLSKKGIPVPNGFAVTASAYRLFLKETGTEKIIQKILHGLDPRDIKNLHAKGRAVRNAILEAEFPEGLKQDIQTAYEKLSHSSGRDDLEVAVRSSATAEDLPNASFAGQQETYLNISGIGSLLESVKKCMASLFTDRAISYREEKHFDHFTIALSVGVQKMVRSDLASSGVMFSLDTESGFRDVVIINASYGLGENIVKGFVNPDEYIVFKPTLRKGCKSIISKTLGSKQKKLIYSIGGNQTTVNVDVPMSDRKNFCLKEREILKLGQWAMIIEDYYGRPMDMEWAKDGVSGKLMIVQARPETVHSTKDRNVLFEYQLLEKGKALVSGQSVGSKIGQGNAHIIKDVAHIADFRQNEVLVTEMTDPDWEPIMKMASGIVTNSGGRTCHAAIISRELGIPCVVGTIKGTEVIRHGQQVTVNCSDGLVGIVLEGLLKFREKKTNIKNLKQPKTKIMMNIGNPESAFSQSFIPNAGVGLARLEFIISNFIKIHPLALIHFSQVSDPKTRDLILELTDAYPSKSAFYIDRLAEGISRIAAAFYPKDVIVRCSDFKSNEYSNLIGGKQFEPIEENPMIGWRGASRYYHPLYRSAFDLECHAYKKARTVFGLRNIKLMIPFCRTPEEGKKVLAILAENGLKRGVDGLEVYVMCEIPSNVILAKEFAKIFDGFSIGTNDLTQLTLGVDRDSPFVSHDYDERSDAVKELIREVISQAHFYNRKIGICGQAPSDFPEFAKFLVEEGIDSISLNPDSVIKTMISLG